MKTLVVYVLHEITPLVNKFFNTSIFEDDNVHFIVVCNISLQLKLPSYVKIIYRENVGYDFGAWSVALLTHEYDYYICVNSSVDGPYCKGKWTDVYINGLKGDVKLFGSTINCCTGPWTKQFPYWSGPHVQSYIFSMDKDTMKYLSNEGIFSLTKFISDKIEVVFLKEILMSKKILDKGWNIGCLLPQYKDVDFKINRKWMDDVMLPQYKDVLWSKTDLIFVKGNRIKP